jgi:hypothetical protein
MVEARFPKPYKAYNPYKNYKSYKASLPQKTPADSSPQRAAGSARDCW